MVLEQQMAIVQNEANLRRVAMAVSVVSEDHYDRTCFRARLENEPNSGFLVHGSGPPASGDGFGRIGFVWNGIDTGPRTRQ